LQQASTNNANLIMTSITVLDTVYTTTPNHTITITTNMLFYRRYLHIAQLIEPPASYTAAGTTGHDRWLKQNVVHMKSHKPCTLSWTALIRTRVGNQVQAMAVRPSQARGAQRFNTPAVINDKRLENS
jgi:hypothetical protein